MGLGISSAGSTCRKKGHEKESPWASSGHRPGAPGRVRQYGQDLSPDQRGDRHRTQDCGWPGVSTGKGVVGPRMLLEEEFPSEVCGVGIIRVDHSSANRREFKLEHRRT